MRLWMLCTLAACGSTGCFGAEFDVLSVKAVESPARSEAPKFTGGPGSDDPGRFHAHAGMFSLLMKAFGAQVDQIVCPDWVRSGQHFYDIDATLPSAASQTEFEAMLQAMLTERFHMRFHRSQKALPGYELRVADLKKLDKYKASKPSSAASLPRSGVSSSARQYDGNNVSMGEFADQLGLTLWSIGLKEGGGFFDPRPRVADKTELSGTYSFTLDYGSAASISLGETAFGTGPANLIAALRSQAGLDLVKVKDVTTEIINVDSLDAVPTAN